MAEYLGSNLIFMVGCARSGTTWAQRLLSSHPNVRTGQESYLFSSYVGPQLRRWNKEMRSISERTFWDGLSCYILDEEFRSTLSDYMTKLLRHMVNDLPANHFFLDKTPSHALWLQEILEMLPECKVIHVKRDGRDVVASLLAASKGWASHWAPRNPRVAAKEWSKNIEAVRHATKGLSSSRFLEIRYESLKASPVQVVRSMLDFLELSWGEEEIQAAIKRNDAREGLEKETVIPLYGEVGRIHGSELRTPIDFSRKGEEASKRRKLGPLAKAQTWLIIHKLMDQEGYPWRYPW